MKDAREREAPHLKDETTRAAKSGAAEGLEVVACSERLLFTRLNALH